ncbi:hypothetical protein [Altererythrobacter sp. CC-YST694]|uniref:hypothetical protein n=1 Tax=Altererythrobacter sp. CC-YST694 TaxID=2755038 RepID=UPI001D03397B|nr:hypothetical protein [Altererythrobacter sp. CC-YST694]
MKRNMCSSWTALPLALAALAMAGVASAQGTPPENPVVADLAAQAAAQFMIDGARPDSTGTGPYRPIKHQLASLPGQTVYQPADLSALGNRKMPVYVFGNGACTEDAASSRQHLLEIASHGYLVIAPGGIFSGPGVAMKPEDWALHRDRTKSTQLSEAIDWAIAENRRAGSPFKGRIATDKVAVSGYSCGGIQAIKFAGDPRVSTLVIMNSGILDPDVPAQGEMKADKSLLDKVDVPILYVLGGPSDIAYPNGMDDYRHLPSVPAAVINIDVTHEGTYNEPNGGKAAQAVLAWLDWQLRGDELAGRWFAGEDCTLCRDSEWTIERKNLTLATQPPRRAQ